MNAAINLNDSFLSNRRFYDDKNYPRGMSRSGDYSISEVQILETHGVALQEIANGTREPQTEAEIRFKGVCDGIYQAESKIEKTWLKYQNKVLTPRQFHTLFGSRKVDDDGDSAPAEDLDLD
ncbi:DUF413 domain-containing protein [Thalassotalea sp. LPB0316]|uniref:DUF413 domain-containing protein n=1 Tax=Thalassotalea sp. LPB0316 TaxID=2769490 RepID=UPI0018665076|nr:DUF413 domain-containing protein [Thalassotalea sp. LPB0316]QOL26971.1 DUF413 domain-containing protein [Thalassotalea sp. LPB0316]